jgi:hypothetical protein
VTKQAACTGTWTMDGVCSPNTCVQPDGSCCYHDGTCAVTKQAACTGTWTMDGVCSPNTCVQPDGSCCYHDGTCAVTKQAECTGTWTMDGLCEPNTCPYGKGDVNCDHILNPDDVPYFVEALMGWYSGCDISLADVDDSGTVDGLDIQPFVNLLLAP